MEIQPEEPRIVLSDIDTAPLSVDTGERKTAEFEELKASFTIVADENAQLKIEIDILKKEIRTTQLLDELIQPYASRSYWFMCAYCAFAGFILVAHGCLKSSFKLPESVLQVLVGSTAVTVIGLVGMVLTGIFVGARRHRGK